MTHTNIRLYGQSRRRATRTISLIAPGLHTIDYVGLVVQGVFKSSRSLDYNIQIHVQSTVGQADNANYFRALITNGLTDGFLLVAPSYFDIFMQLCLEYNLPCVAVEGAINEHVQSPTLRVTDRQGLMDAVCHLVALGHRRIGFVTGLMHIHSARERLQGYREALQALGLPYDPTLVCEGDWGRESGYTGARQLLALEAAPTAIVASNDLMAFGVIDAIKEAALTVGSEVSVIGFDDIPDASTHIPPLTTLRQPMEEMGCAAVEMLIDMIEGHSLSQFHRYFNTQLIVRQSTGPLKP